MPNENLELNKPFVTKLEKGYLEKKEDAGKVWPQYLSVLTALLSIFISGLHFGWPSPSIPKILSNEYPHNISSDEASYITIIGPVGDIFGSVLFPSFVDVIGRRKTIVLIGVPQLVSFWLIYFSGYSKVLLYMARVIGGLSEAACFTILPIYIGEVTEPKVRGILGSYLTILLLLGVLVVNLVGSYLTIFNTALIFSFFPILSMIIFSQMPESPYYLIMKKDLEGAERNLKTLRRKINVEIELEIIVTTVKNQMKEKGTFKDLFYKKQNRKACIIIAGVRTVQQFSGIAALISYIQILLSKVKIIPKHVSSSIIFILQIFASIGSTFIVDKLGRKPLLLFSTTGCFFILLAHGIFFAYEDFSNSKMPENYDIFPIFGITLFMLVWSIGLGGVVNLMLGEVFATNIKAKASCVMNILMALLIIISTKLYQFTSDNLSICVPFFFFAFCQCLGFFFVYFYVPETKGKTLDEIQTLLKGGQNVGILLKNVEK